VSTRTAAPSTSFTVKAQDSGGTVVNSPVALSLQFDPTYLPSTPDYSKIQATLYVSGSAVGSTNGTGGFTPWTGDTGGSGILSGAVVLNTDTLGNGARVNLVVSAPADVCWPPSGALAQPVTYLKLNLASANPAGCTETSPCLIAAGATSPKAVGTLSLNNVPVAGATVNFTKTDFQTTPGTPPASAVFQPTASAATDGTGAASVYVANNGAASITAGNPLTTTVDASTLAETLCTSPSIVPVSAKPKFLYQGSSTAGTCDAHLQSSWISLVGAKKGVASSACMNVQNPGSGGLACGLKPTGIKLAVYTSAGVLDPTMLVSSINAGAISASADCSATGAITVFKTSCRSSTNLPNNTRWDFGTGGCPLPPNAAGAGQYFVINNITWTTQLSPPTNRRIDVTLYYGCDGFCSGSPGVSETWTVAAP
jgi:hypothetical protein